MRPRVYVPWWLYLLGATLVAIVTVGLWILVVAILLVGGLGYLVWKLVAPTNPPDAREGRQHAQVKVPFWPEYRTRALDGALAAVAVFCALYALRFWQSSDSKDSLHGPLAILAIAAATGLVGTIGVCVVLFVTQRRRRKVLLHVGGVGRQS